MVGEKSANHINSITIMHIAVKHKCNKALRALPGQARDDHVTAVHNLFWGKAVDVPEKEGFADLSSHSGHPARGPARL